MTVTLKLAPEIEQALAAQAATQDLSLEDYVEQLLERDVRQASGVHTECEAQNLVELFEKSPFKGLDISFERDRHLDQGRKIEL